MPSNSEAEAWTLDWAHGRAQVRRIGAMLAPLEFRLPDGRLCAPFYIAPWADEAPAPDTSPMMQGLRGEWPCAPFGPAVAPEHLPTGWTVRSGPRAWDHGHASHHAWTLLSQGPGVLELGITLPAADALTRMERRLQADPDHAAITVSTTLVARADTVLPFALHPTFAVPPGGLSLSIGPLAGVHTYPVPPVPGVSRLQPGCSAAGLDAVPARDGPQDLRHFPLAHDTEELVQLQACPSPIVLHRAQDGVTLSLSWDTAQLPDVLLWISQRGRQHAPWSGRNVALGVEPCLSCFDLTRVAEPPADHPLAHRRGLALRAGQAVTLSYRLAAESVG